MDGSTGGPSYQVSHSALPLRAYNLIFNEWFRDENLVQASVVNVGDGPDVHRQSPGRHRPLTGA